METEFFYLVHACFSDRNKQIFTVYPDRIICVCVIFKLQFLQMWWKGSMYACLTHLRAVQLSPLIQSFNLPQNNNRKP